MSVVCKYCRASYEDGAATVCTVCGSRLPVSEPCQVGLRKAEENAFDKKISLEDLRFTLFEASDWEKNWNYAVGSASSQSRQAGIILTDMRGADKSLLNAFKRNVSEYIDFKRSEGVDYYVLDLSRQAVRKVYTGEAESLVDLLKRVYEAAHPEYLMVLGDFNTVPNIKWENKSKDSDRFVFSDLHLITLDPGSPFNDILYELDTKMKVGRIPTSAQSGFEDAFTYLKNTRESKLSKKDMNAFFLTTDSWLKTSETVGADIPGHLCVSPDNGVFEFNGPLESYGILMFNLHGSAATHYWYGEKGNVTGAAFKAGGLPKSGNYILASEACYGARPFNDGKNSESMVSTALRGGCCAFVGSTQIAYGMTNGSMSCADIIEKYFIENMREGYSAGESFNDALVQLSERNRNDALLKTLMEFALYGDPSYAVLGSENRSRTKVKQRAFSRMDLSYRVVDGEEQKAVSVKAAYVEESLEASLKAFVEEEHPTLIDVKPRYYMDECTGDYQAVYTKSFSECEIPKILKVYFNADGSVKEEYVSK